MLFLLRPLLLCGFLMGSPLPASDAWANERARVREARTTLRDQAAADVARRAGDAERAIAGLLETAEKQRVHGQDAAFTRLLAGLATLDTDRAAALEARWRALPAEPETLDRSHAAAWKRALERTQRQALTRTGDLLNRSIGMGLLDLAHGFLHEALAFDPDNAGIRRGLGQVAVEGRWLGAFEQQMVRQGLWWDEALGWIQTKEQARYTDGAYFDLQGRAWTSETEANVRRATVGNEWIFRTGRLKVHSTLPLRETVAVVNALERFYAAVFAAYAGFFATGPADYRLVFGIAEHPPLVVWVSRDREQFRSHGAGLRGPNWAAGFWSPRDNTSYFYGGVNTVMYHEFTHQLFHVFADGNRAPIWITEGIAIYSETPGFDGPYLVLGDYRANRRFTRHRADARAGTHLNVERLLALTPEAWSATSGDAVGRQYNAAGALMWWLMEADQRRYRSDTVDYIRDAYRGTTNGRQIWEYLGIPRATFLEAYQTWERAAE